MRNVLAKEARLQELVREKIQSIIETMHTKDTCARWDMRFFGVEKGELDIRIVCDRSNKAINLAACPPPFFPTNRINVSKKIGSWDTSERCGHRGDFP